VTRASLSGRQRVERLLVAAHKAAAQGTRARRELVDRLLHTSGLSRPGIEWALERCLELTPGETELSALVQGVLPARRAHVILPANVFVAAHRAIALALAAAPHVFVKPSRREPALVEALHAQTPGLFELVSELEVEPGDHVFAYGSDETLEELRRGLPEGAVLHAHGSGFGVAVVDLQSDALLASADGIAEDTACFDQRGCLSPRFVLALGGGEGAVAAFAEQLARSMAQLERRLPLGSMDAAELADVTWHRQCAACFGRVIAAGSGAITLRDADAPRVSNDVELEVPPAGRHLELLAVRELEPALEAFRPWLTSIGCGDDALVARLKPRFERARVVRVGQMQRPLFDGAADLRGDARGEVISRR
jgi:hypothetical protein